MGSFNNPAGVGQPAVTITAPFLGELVRLRARGGAGGTHTPSSPAAVSLLGLKLGRKLEVLETSEIKKLSPTGAGETN